MSGKQIIFVERASDAAAAARLAGEQGDSTIIALNSSVIWALDKQGVEHRIGLDYYDVSELHALKEDLYPRTEEICEVINDVLPSCCGTLGADQIEWAKSIFHPIKCLLNTVTQQLLHVARAIRTERPDQVTVFTPGPEKPLSELNLDPASINLWQTSAATAAWFGSWMSVVTGNPVVSRTLARISIPASKPGPRKLSMLVRFALSKLDLNTSGTPKSAAISARRRATCRTNASLSITHGPAMNRSGSPLPQRMSPSLTGFAVTERPFDPGPTVYCTLRC